MPRDLFLRNPPRACPFIRMRRLDNALDEAPIVTSHGTQKRHCRDVISHLSCGNSSQNVLLGQTAWMRARLCAPPRGARLILCRQRSDNDNSAAPTALLLPLPLPLLPPSHYPCPSCLPHIESFVSEQGGARCRPARFIVIVGSNFRHGAQ